MTNKQDSITTDNKQDSITTDNKQDSITNENKQDSITNENKQDSITNENKQDSITNENKQDSITNENKQDSITTDNKHFTNFSHASFEDFLTQGNSNLKSAAYIWHNKNKEERESKGLHFAIDASSCLILFISIFLLITFFYEVEHDKAVDLNKYLSHISNFLPVLIGYVIGKKI